MGFWKNWWIYILSMHMHLFRSNMAVSTWRFYCFLQCCGSLFHSMCAHCFYCVCAVHHTVLLITYSYWKLITHYADCILRHIFCTFASWMPDKLNQILPLLLDLILHRDAAGNTAVNKTSLLLMTVGSLLMQQSPLLHQTVCKSAVTLQHI